MRLWIFLLFIVLCSIAYAQEDLVGKSFVVIDSGIYSNIQAQPESSNAKIDHIITNLYFFPKQDQTTHVLNLKTTPRANVGSDRIEWVWIENQKNFDFGVESTIKSYPSFARLQKRKSQQK